MNLSLTDTAYADLIEQRAARAHDRTRAVRQQRTVIVYSPSYGIEYIDPFLANRDLSARNPGHVEEVIDQPGQMIRLPLDNPARAFGGGRMRIDVRQQKDGRANWGEAT